MNSGPSNGLIDVSGIQLYYELYGSGPLVLFISGTTSDAGHFEQVARLLADEFTVVTYDRRGNSRSPLPVGWNETSMDEQADDAAGLIRALGLGPAAAFGTSGGAVILLNLLLRHPEVLRGAIVHEPSLVPVLSNAEEVAAMIKLVTEDSLVKVDPRGTMELVLRQNIGDANFENLVPELRERMLGNAEVTFFIELAAFSSYVPDARALAEVKVPVQVVAGTDSRGVYYYEAAEWVAKRLGTKLREIPGAHTPYFDRPKEMAEAIRPFLREVSR